MKKLSFIALAILVSATATFAQAKKDSSHQQTKQSATVNKYTCSMNSEVVTTKPGKCPKCGMALVPVAKKGSKTTRSKAPMAM